MTVMTFWSSSSVAPWRITISTTSLPSDGEPVAVVRRDDLPRKTACGDPCRVRILDRGIEVRQDELLRPRLASQIAGPLRRQMPIHRQRLRERAFRQQQIAPCGPARELGRGPGVPCVHEPATK